MSPVAGFVGDPARARRPAERAAGGHLRRRRHRGRDDRCGHRARRGEPRAARRAPRARRPRRGHELQVLEAGPRRAALPPPARVPPRLREPPRAPAAAWTTHRTSCDPSRSSSPCSVRTAWSPRRSPGATAARCGSTTRPVASASASATRSSRRTRCSPTCPSLDVERLVAGFRYWDARGDDARIVLALARTAAERYGAVVATRAAVTGVAHDADGRATAVEVTPIAPGDACRALQSCRPRRRERDGGLGRRGHVPRRGPRGAHAHPRQGRARDGAGLAAAVPLRGGAARAEGPSLGLRRALGGRAVHLHRDDRHGLRRARSTIRSASPRTWTTSSARSTPPPRPTSPAPT